MKVVGMLFSPIIKSVFGAIFKKPKPGEPARPIERDDAQVEADKRRELASRRGGAADILTGDLGASAGPGAKTNLGS